MTENVLILAISFLLHWFVTEFNSFPGVCELYLYVKLAKAELVTVRMELKKIKNAFLSDGIWLNCTHWHQGEMNWHIVSGKVKYFRLPFAKDWGSGIK